MGGAARLGGARARAARSGRGGSDRRGRYGRGRRARSRADQHGLGGASHRRARLLVRGIPVPEYPTAVVYALAAAKSGAQRPRCSPSPRSRCPCPPGQGARCGVPSTAWVSLIGMVVSRPGRDGSGGGAVSRCDIRGLLYQAVPPAGKGGGVGARPLQLVIERQFACTSVKRLRVSPKVSTAPRAASVARRADRLSGRLRRQRLQGTIRSIDGRAAAPQVDASLRDHLAMIDCGVERLNAATCGWAV
jgi:hypothetical protein